MEQSLLIVMIAGLTIIGIPNDEETGICKPRVVSLNPQEGVLALHILVGSPEAVIIGGGASYYYNTDEQLAKFYYEQIVPQEIPMPEEVVASDEKTGLHLVK